MSEVIELNVEKLAGLGDGVAQLKGSRIYIAYTLPGDMVRARITRKTRDAIYAELEEVIVSGPGRTQPVCRHFADCGGCALQHVNAAMYADFKQQTAREAARKAGFDVSAVLPLFRPPAASRRRAELKIEGGKLGYYAQGSHRLVDISECKVLEPQLETLILRLKPELVALPGLTAIQVNGVDDGYDVVLSGSQEELRFVRHDAGADILRVSVREENGIRILHQSGPVTATLGGIRVEVPPGAFLQASREAQALMTERVLEGAGAANHVLDLFAGIGTYSFPLLAGAEVTAIEGDGAMVDAMRAAAAGRKGFRAIQRDLFRQPVERFQGFDAVVINPPRTGAKLQTEKLARSGIPRIVMVSCNPATFARDARILKEGGYRLRRLLPVDQFVFSAHLELVAEFER